MSSKAQPPTAAKQAVWDHCAAVRPAWRAVASARELVGLPDRTILHAGPPFADPANPSAVILSSAVIAILHEGWASSEGEAEQMVRRQLVRLAPAQQWGGVVPLAAVVSGSTPLVEVVDAGSVEEDKAGAWSILASGVGAQIRFGTRDPALLERLRWRDRVLAPALADLLKRARPLPLWPVAATALAAGDDLHAQTTHANRALQGALGALGVLPAEVAHMLERSPLFFLTLWMAACHRVLGAARAVEKSPSAQAAQGGLVLAMAGNGTTFGVRVLADPDRWFCAPAPTPRGALVPGEPCAVAPLVGDSGVIDAVGLGAQALHLSEPALQAHFQPWRSVSPSDASGTRFAHALPGWSRAGAALSELPFGFDAFAIARTGVAPEIAIAMLEAGGQRGLVGRGIALAPLQAFEAAAAALG